MDGLRSTTGEGIDSAPPLRHEAAAGVRRRRGSTRPERTASRRHGATALTLMLVMAGLVVAFTSAPAHAATVRIVGGSTARTAAIAALTVNQRHAGRIVGGSTVRTAGIGSPPVNQRHTRRSKIVGGTD